MNLDFAKMNGLLPAIIQDFASGKVLMLGFQNEEAFQKTQETGEVHFFSRTKNRLWKKGETSGNVLRVREVLKDCDSDSLLILVDAPAETCHTGSFSCFGESKTADFSFLPDLENLIQSRKTEKPENSYLTSLFETGIDRIAQKVGEEAVETVIAAKNTDKEDFQNESADLLFHLLVLLAEKETRLSEILAVLKARKK